MEDEYILIVEDDAIAQLTLAQYLQDLGFPRSLAVNNGKDAIEAIKENVVTLALLDIRIMGEWDGVATAQRIKENQPDLPLVFLTANTDRNTMERAQEVHPYSIIRKPYDRKTLLEVIGGALNYHVVAEAPEEEPLQPSFRVFEAPETGVSLTDAQGTLVSVNREFCNIHHCTESEAVGRPFTDYFPENIRKFAYTLHQDFMEGHTDEGGGEWTVVGQHGAPKEVSIKVSRLSLENQHYKVSTFVDVSQQKKEAKKLRKVLEEKDAFAREIHHRVKNNLNVISGLFYLQAEKIKERPDVYGLFQESISRIKTMSIIHEQLYNYEEYATINLGKYVQLLAETIRSTFRDTDQVSLKVRVEPIQLDVDQAVACGLIINEVMTNSLKYAFNRPQPHPEIAIKGTVRNHTITLRIQDNGIGLPESSNTEEAKTLGIQLIKTLADQLHAQLNIQSAPKQGTSVSLTFTP